MNDAFEEMQRQDTLELEQKTIAALRRIKVAIVNDGLFDDFELICYVCGIKPENVK